MKNIALLALLALVLIVPAVFAEDLPDELRAFAEQRAQEEGLDVSLVLQAASALAKAEMARNAGKVLLAEVYEAYAQEEISYAIFLQEADAFPKEKMAELEESGGPVPEELVEPLNRLGSAYFVMLADIGEFHKSRMALFDARLDSCVEERGFLSCLEDSQQLVTAMEDYNDSLAAMTQDILPFALAENAKEGGWCCIDPNNLDVE